MKAFFRDFSTLFLLCLPLFVYLILMSVYDAVFKIIAKEFLFNGSMLLLLLSVLFATTNKIVKFIFSVFLLCFYSLLMIQVGVFYTFYNFIDQAVLYTLFETNTNEVKGFLDSYFKWYYIVFTLVYFYFVIRIIFSYRFTLAKYKIIPVLLVLACLGVGYRFFERSVLLLTANTYSEYQNFTSQLSNKIARKESNYFTNVENDDQEALYVVIIGESTSRRNMGIYGYYRDTNPKLNLLKDELFLFNDVISPRTHTILSLDRVFSLGDFHNPELNELGTIFQLANQAGFTTYWLSNQEPLGLNETLVSLYAKATHYQHFVTNTNKNSHKLDEVLLPLLDDVIQDKQSKKMVFLHLKGTHIFYWDAYPPSFSYFNDQPKTQFPSEEAFQTINAYDNAIRYNDFVVSEIIKKVRSRNTNSFVIYFSDHGDDVFQDNNSFGHHEGIGTNAMYEVPLVVWLSEQYKFKSPEMNIRNKLTRKYTLEDFIYSFSDLSRIRFDQFQPHKSIFNDQYIYKKRMVSPGVNYDERN